MDAVIFFKEKRRMCVSFGGDSCTGCLINMMKGVLRCSQFCEKYPERAVDIVETWAKEHPRKTILQDFWEKYPKAELIHNKFPEICPHSLGYATNKECFLDTDEQFVSEECEECWNRPLEEE